MKCQCTLVFQQLYGDVLHTGYINVMKRKIIRLSYRASVLRAVIHICAYIRIGFRNVLLFILAVVFIFKQGKSLSNISDCLSQGARGMKVGILLGGKCFKRFTQT